MFKTRAEKIARFLEVRDNQLMASDGPCRDTLEGCEAAAKREQELVEALELFLRSTHEHNDYCSMGAVYKCNCLLGEVKRTARHALDTIKRNADASHS